MIFELSLFRVLAKACTYNTIGPSSTATESTQPNPQSRSMKKTTAPIPNNTAQPAHFQIPASPRTVTNPPLNTSDKYHLQDTDHVVAVESRMCLTDVQRCTSVQVTLIPPSLLTFSACRLADTTSPAEVGLISSLSGCGRDYNVPVRVAQPTRTVIVHKPRFF
ncbi:hypothetical protein BJX68DRAFT_227624 [Aspergillus pseudodeflectus]|uniref:Uncharacterized protein n=1 Tax=Aspergillus pseudodeflectus TaxID=176178 RepID=A0ABR4L374_9EURO